MRRKILGYVNEFKGLEQAAEAHDKRKRLPPALITEGLEISHRVYYSDDVLISLRLTHTVMAIGQMHPIDYYETINYDLRKEGPLRERDLFKRGYLKVFSNYARKELEEKYDLRSMDDWLKRGTAPTKDNFKNWNIVPDGILIAFEDYQIASHSFGQAEMIIPYSILVPVLRSGRWGAAHFENRKKFRRFEGHLSRRFLWCREFRLTLGAILVRCTGQNRARSRSRVAPRATSSRPQCRRFSTAAMSSCS